MAAPKAPKDNVRPEDEQAVKDAAAKTPPSKTADRTPPGEDDTTNDRSDEAGHVRPSIPDEFSGIATPETDPDKTTPQ
jgi:hypothetical protein